MKLRRFLLLSVVLHAGMLALFLRRHHEEATAPEAVMVDLPAPEAPVALAPSRGGTSSHPAKAPLPFSALAPVHKPLLAPSRPGEAVTEAPDTLSPYAASEDILKSASPEETGALAWVYRKAQLTIGYPEAFIRHDITGGAQARLVFDKSGRLKPELLHVSADSPYLRVYVYRVLESTFTREPVPARLVRWPDTFEVFCFVKFSFAESSTAVAVSSPTIVGNKLFFARRTVKSSAEKLKWNLGPLHGLFPVPVVGMDMTWFYRKYDEHKHPLRAAAEADDLAPFRKDPLFYD